MITLAVRIGNIIISSYFLMLALGTVGMFMCAYIRRQKFGIETWQCAALIVLLTFTGVVGAMLLFFLENGSFGGVSFYGSVFLIPILMSVAGLPFRLKPTQTLDICGPCVAIMIGCMRFNCFLSGCCGGNEFFIGKTCITWPTQAIDSICDFLILFWLLHLEKQGKAAGKLYPLFMVFYSIMRFFLEFLRGKEKDWLLLSHGQWFSIVAIVLGTGWMYYCRKNL